LEIALRGAGIEGLVDEYNQDAAIKGALPLKEAKWA